MQPFSTAIIFFYEVPQCGEGESCTDPAFVKATNGKISASTVKFPAVVKVWFILSDCSQHKCSNKNKTGSVLPDAFVINDCRLWTRSYWQTARISKMGRFLSPGQPAKRQKCALSKMPRVDMLSKTYYMDAYNVLINHAFS